MDIKQYLEKNKRSSLAQPKKNFTLVELAVVITTIGTLAAIVIPNATNKVADARVSALKQDIAHIEQALMQHEIENPEVPVLSKVEASELGSKLKSTVEKELNDDASDVYRIDMKVLKDYLHKTKYGHLEDDAKEDEYFFSKKTNRVYYEKGYSTSKGYRVHYLGSGNAKMQSAIKQLKPVKVISTLPVTYYLLENGDLYAEGYNYYGMMMQAEKITGGGTYDSLEYIPLKKIASNVKSLRVPAINYLGYLDPVYVGCVKLDGTVEVFTATGGGPDEDFVLSFVHSKIKGKDFSATPYYNREKPVVLDDQNRLYSFNAVDQKFYLWEKDVKRLLPTGFETVDGKYKSFESSGLEEYVRLKDSDPNKGLPLSFVKFTKNNVPLFKAGENYYLPSEDESEPIDMTGKKDLEGVTSSKYIYKDLADTLYLNTGKQLAMNVDEAYWMNMDYVIYRKGLEVYVFNTIEQQTTKVAEDAQKISLFSSGVGYVNNSDSRPADALVIKTTTDSLLQLKFDYGEPPSTKKLIDDVASFEPSDTINGVDSLLVKKKDATTSRVRLSSMVLIPFDRNEEYVELTDEEWNEKQKTFQSSEILTTEGEIKLN